MIGAGLVKVGTERTPVHILGRAQPLSKWPKCRGGFPGTGL